MLPVLSHNRSFVEQLVTAAAIASLERLGRFLSHGAGPYTILPGAQRITSAATGCLPRPGQEESPARYILAETGCLNL